MDYIYRYASPLGAVTMASDGCALTGLWFDEQKHYAYSLSEERREMGLQIFEETIAWLDIYFSGRIPDFKPKVFLNGSDFRLSVWNILKTIPFGKTASYGEIAKILAKERGIQRMSARAVGSAVGHNPISIIIPCHRVIGSDGSPGGYAGGTERKLALLRLEGAKLKVLA